MLATVVVPTRLRPDYLRVTLLSLKEQSIDHGLFELVVVDDGSPPGEAEQVASLCLHDSMQWQVIHLGNHSGLNAARNAGIKAASSDLIVFVDDDVQAPPDWLSSYTSAAERYPGYEAFGGPIRARLEGSKLHLCGREKPPITTLDLGADDRDVEHVWGANMAVRRSAFDRAGLFDASYKSYGGDEEEWEQLLLERGGKIRYIGGASLWHRRSPSDSRLLPLSRAAFRQGRGLRAFDRKRGGPPPLSEELKVFAGCVGHAARYRCSGGIIMAAHSAGRIADAGRNG